MLASQTGLPLLQKYIHEKNQGSVIQKIDGEGDRRHARSAASWSRRDHQQAQPRAAISRRSPRLS